MRPDARPACLVRRVATPSRRPTPPTVGGDRRSGCRDHRQRLDDRAADGRRTSTPPAGPSSSTSGTAGARSPRVMAEQAGRLAYAHGSAFTTEPLEAYAAEPRPLLPRRRSGHLPGQRRLRGDRDRAQARPRLPPGPRRDRALTSSSPAGGATTATPSARSTCPAAGRCAGRTSRGWAAFRHVSAAYPVPRRRSRQRTPWPTADDLAAELDRAIRGRRAADASPRSWPSRSSGRRWPPPSRRTTTGRRSPRSAAATASSSSPTRS